MDYDELVEKVERLEREIQELRTRPPKDQSDAINSRLFVREEKTDQYVTTTTVTHDGGSTEDILHNTQYDQMLVIDVDGKLYAIGVYPLRV